MMAEEFSFSITGLDSLLKKLEAVEYSTRHRVGKNALLAAARVVRADVKSEAEKFDDPETARSIAENTAIRWRGPRGKGAVAKNTGFLRFRVGILGGAKLPRKGTPPDKSAGAPTPHWRLIEFGTEKMPAQPFFRQALQKNVNRCTDTFVTEYEKGIDRAIKRATKGK